MKYYRLNLTQEEFETRGEAEEALREYAENTYDDMLDELYGEIEICGLTYYASIALERVDPIAYRCGLNDYEDSLYEEIEEIESEEEDND